MLLGHVVSCTLMLVCSLSPSMLQWFNAWVTHPSCLEYGLVAKRATPRCTCSSQFFPSRFSRLTEGWFLYDRRLSRIADRKKFCDRLRSYGNTLLRSSAILRSIVIVRSYGNQSSAICDRNVSQSNLYSDP